ncbi:MAG TPA: MlaD family protein [Casimicrobiaceae bacterium]|nr:MlaD family protein [Casimicrobiaceae bacterium]
MSLRANYYKLGLFVIGAVACAVAVLLIVGSGRWFTPKLTVETYFNESVQGLDIGSRLKYRGVVIGDVTRITFTYTRYQQQRPMSERSRYVLVEAEIQPRLLGGRSAAGDFTDPKTAAIEAERGLRVRLTPQGITGTSYLEIDYVDPASNPPLPIDWDPLNPYVPSARSTLTSFVDAASEIVQRLQNLDVEGTLANMNKLLATTNERIGGIDTKAIGKQTERTLAKIEGTLDSIAAKRISNEMVALLQDVRKTNAELQATIADPAWRQVPKDASAAVADLRKVVADPRLPATLGHLERTLGRLDRLTGGGETDLSSTIANLRTITENLRQLTEDTKRYPANVIFGKPPPPTPLERVK